jgi:class 3 adenylate cyclase|tara:strand:+ start:175 stop:369 length:195 start_codon:yes stop_codon:yes gene_type:complete
MSVKDKRKLAAIMFTDVVGYSRMMASNEERTLELLKDFENICSPIISDNEGKIIKQAGDGVRVK